MLAASFCPQNMHQAIHFLPLSFCLPVRFEDRKKEAEKFVPPLQFFTHSDVEPGILERPLVNKAIPLIFSVQQFAEYSG